ncbi:hypothetical protein AYI70_g2588 [Smittium culicis]|uniref:Uncharacterized protein n=1 Tax=Smittium culicis TaxID=133412 RepID=A0A1R1Y7M0_9FUNG|nr:hypothetical protein AYI70_g2588 [Smittium culicis]
MIFLVIWKYHEPLYSIILDVLTYTSHATSLAVLFGISSKWAAVVVLFGLSCRQLVTYLVVNFFWKVFQMTL